MVLKHSTVRYHLLNLIFQIQIFYFVIIKQPRIMDYQKKITMKNQIEVEILNPFAGILGEDLNIIFNSIAKDKKALDELDFSN